MLTGKTTASADVVEAKKAPLPLSINSLNILYGPPINNLGQHSSADSEIDALQPMYIRNQIGFGYKLSENTKIIPTLDFDLWMADAGSKAENEGFHWRDCFLRINQGGLVDTTIGGNKIGLDGDLRLFVPTAKGSRDTNRIGAVRATLNPSMQFGGSRFSLSASLYAKYYLQADDTNAKGVPLDRLAVYAGPQLNYEVNDKITAFVLYEATTVYNTHGMPDYINYNTSNTDLEPGLDLKLHERFSLSPVLNWYTNQKLSTTSLVLTAALKLL